MSRPSHLEPTPEARLAGARAVAAAIGAAHHVLLTTHVNADGDGVGSEVALVHLLGALGKRVAIANPTPIPDRYRFLVDPLGARDRTAQATQRSGVASQMILQRLD